MSDNPYEPPRALIPDARPSQAAYVWWREWIGIYPSYAMLGAMLWFIGYSYVSAPLFLPQTVNELVLIAGAVVVAAVFVSVRWYMGRMRRS